MMEDLAQVRDHAIEQIERANVDPDVKRRMKQPYTSPGWDAECIRYVLDAWKNRSPL